MNTKQRAVYYGYQVLRGARLVADVGWRLTRLGGQLFFRWVFRGRVSNPMRWPR